MARMTLKMWTDKNKDNVVLQMEADDEPMAHMYLDAASTEKTIHDLARHRSQLNEPVTPDLDPGARMEAIVDPVWRGPGEKVAQGRVLALRHPGLGWVTFVFPDHEIPGIIEYLQRPLPSG